MYNVLFNGNEISAVPGVDLYNHDFNNLPTREVKIYKLARRNKSIITSAEYSQKTIPVYLEICSGTRGDTEDTMTAVKALLQAQNAPLQVTQGGTQVQYTATMNEFNHSWSGITALVEIVFIASDPIGFETTLQTLFTSTVITTSTASVNFTSQGSATVEPQITLTVGAVTGGTGQSITVANGATGQGITITRTWIAGDILTIDSSSLNVTVNGALVDFTGGFPVFPAGMNQVVYTDSFTTRSVTLSGQYNPRLV